MARDVAAEIRRIAEERILVLDGSWGVLLQGRGLSEADFRGERFAGHTRDVLNDPDLLNLTRPDIVREVHDAYFAAGADITTTNTFTATSIGQADYGLEDAVHDMNVAGARIARESAGDRYVAGSVGPLNIALTLSPRVDDPGFRTHTFDEVKAAYAEQIRGLAEGGVDLLLIETIFDTLYAKAAIVAAREVAPDLPLWTHADRADDRGVLDLRRARRAADRGDQLLARGQRDGPVRRRPLAGRAVPRLLSPERGPAECVRRLRRDARRDLGAPPRVRARRPPERGRLLLRLGAGAHEGNRRRGPRSRAEARSVAAEAAAVQRPGVVRNRCGHRLRLDR